MMKITKYKQQTAYKDSTYSARTKTKTSRDGCKTNTPNYPLPPLLQRKHCSVTIAVREMWSNKYIICL